MIDAQVTTEPLYRNGERILVIWGKYGYIPCIVDRITSSGSIYVKRWNKRRRMYTTARRIEFYNGVYHVI